MAARASGTQLWDVEHLAHVVVWLADHPRNEWPPEDVADCIEWCREQVKGGDDGGDAA